ncbi:MAG: ATP-binding protein [Candidatus Eisenbacteria bacterium]
MSEDRIAANAAPRGDAQSIKGLEDHAQRMFALLRLSTFLHGLNDLGPVASATLGALTSADAYDFREAALFLRHDDRNELVGVDACARQERTFSRRVWELVDHFPESIAEFLLLRDEPSELARRVRALRMAWPERKAGQNPEQELEHWERVLSESPEIAAALGPGEWRFLLLRGMRGAIALLALRGDEIIAARPGTADSSPAPGSARVDLSIDDELLLGFCYHAGIALERGRLRAQLERRLEEMSTVQMISRSILTATNLEDLLMLVARTAARAVEASWALAWVADGPEEELRLLAAWGAAAGDPLTRNALGTHAAQCSLEQKPRTPRLGEPISGQALLVPLVAFDRTVGVLAVGGKVSGERQGDAFHRADLDFLAILGAQAAVAVKNAQLFAQVKETERRLREAQNLLLQSEKLAALGEMSAKVAHEIRNPLSAVGGFARRIQRALPSDDPNAQHAELIVREIERLESILTEQLEFARLSRPRLSNLDLNGLVQETLLLVREAAGRKGVAILDEAERDLPLVLLDGDKVKQVLLNILRNALDAVSEGNRILIRTARVDGDVRIEIANDGEPIPGEALESLFVPFATTRPGGTGLGLAVARQIVQDHGGEIQIRTGVDRWSVVFTVSFPIRENQERRKFGRERRAAAARPAAPRRLVHARKLEPRRNL